MPVNLIDARRAWPAGAPLSRSERPAAPFGPARSKVSVALAVADHAGSQAGHAQPPAFLPAPAR